MDAFRIRVYLVYVCRDSYVNLVTTTNITWCHDVSVKPEIKAGYCHLNKTQLL